MSNEYEVKLMRTSDDVVYFFKLDYMGWNTNYVIEVFSVSKSGLEGEKARVEVATSTFQHFQFK